MAVAAYDFDKMFSKLRAVHERPTQPELPPEPTSRLNARCTGCDHEGSRTIFMTPRPGYPGLFDDSCPRCRSTSIEVYDPNFSRL